MTSSPLSSFLTLEVLGFFVTILVPFGIAIWKISDLNTKLNSLKDDVRQLKDVTNDLNTKINAYLLAREWYDKMTMDSSSHKAIKGDNDDYNE